MPRYHQHKRHGLVGHPRRHHHRRNDSGPWTQGGVRVLASRYKTQLCRTFAAAGVCPYGAECMFAHGEHELRTRALNEADGLVSVSAVRSRQCSAPVSYTTFAPGSAASTQDAVLCGTHRDRTAGSDELWRSHYRQPEAAAVPLKHGASSAVPAAPSAWIGCSVRGRARYMHDPYRAVTAVVAGAATLDDA